MTTPVLPGFYDQGVVADPLSMGKGERKRGFVPASSVEAYRERANPAARMASVVALLSMHIRECGNQPTSAELAHTRYEQVHGIFTVVHLKPPLELVLWVRRGLSDALAHGLVEHSEKRNCAIAGSLAVTWKVKSR